MEYKEISQEINGVKFKRKYADRFVVTEVDPDFNQPEESMYAVVLSSLIRDPRFTPAEKIVILEISALSRRNGFCYATKGYIAKAINTSIRTIENALRKMEEYQIAERVYTNKLVDKDGKEYTGTYQRIYWKQQPFEGVSQINQGGVGKKVSEGVGRNYQHKTEYKKQSVITNNLSNIDRGVSTRRDKSHSNVSSKERTDRTEEKGGIYGNKDIQVLKAFLIKYYPKPLDGVGDTRKLWNLYQVAHPRKGLDEWMDSQWKKNIESFLRVYLDDTEDRFLVGSVDKLKEKAKLWREYRGKLN